jgi:hypothetical protein
MFEFCIGDMPARVRAGRRITIADTIGTTTPTQLKPLG